MASSALKTAGFLAGAAFTEGMYRLYGTYDKLTEDHKKHLKEKLQEAAGAVFKDAKQGISTEGFKKKISLVLALPSKQQTNENQSHNIEKYLQQRDYGRSYLVETKTSFKGEGFLVYHFEQQSERFAFAGEASKLMSPIAREAIIKGDYRVCDSSYFIPSGNVVIAAKADCDLCDLFKKHVNLEIKALTEAYFDEDHDYVEV